MKNYDYENCPQGLSQKGDQLNINYLLLKKIINSQIANGKKIKILEIGSGGGRNLQFLKNRYGSKIELFGTDISKTAISYALSSKIGRFKIAESDQIPFKQKFDLVLMIDLLEHLNSKTKALTTIRKALESTQIGGRIYISVPIELNRFSLTWYFSKLPYFKNLTKLFFGHIIQFKIRDFNPLLKNKKVKVIRSFSVHFLTQLQILLFFHIPKILIGLIFNKKTANNLRDSNEIIRGRRFSFLGIFKQIFLALRLPLLFLAYCESLIRIKSRFGAENMHLTIIKKT